MSAEHDGVPSPDQAQEAPAAGSEHLNIKVTDNNNEVFFKIKRGTKLEKLMNAWCERQGKSITSVRFLFDGSRVQPTDTPDAVRFRPLPSPPHLPPFPTSRPSAPVFALRHPTPHGRDVLYCADDPPQQLEMADGDTLEVHQEQVGGAAAGTAGAALW
ncbi:ubiquitin-like modifier SUMO [Purpureocillium lavendulum]|uniref:Ubiquitin-like modifier SUMO n=1 Tax=Purpureocillium lavendulum TaxID=1247861 RepID=A0AB34G2F8_9HYPO|nr:ubiquitin-like modifier SUMO [Purpureocillium lavendulum]